MRQAQESTTSTRASGSTTSTAASWPASRSVAPSSGWSAPVGAALGVQPVLVDGHPVPNGVVPLRDDGREHHVRAALGSGRRYDMADTPRVEEDQNRLPTDEDLRRLQWT